MESASCMKLSISNLMTVLTKRYTIETDIAAARLLVCEPTKVEYGPCKMY